ncbi:MAG: phosphopyruvate hydratase [Planctomycetota bacterium]
MIIRSVSAYQIFDSRGNPTVEAEIVLEGGACGRGTVPSGASTGQYEALELRDGDPQRFRGKSVFRAIEHIQREIASAVVGRDAADQRGLDETLIALDGTDNKSRLGANAILAVSMAACSAEANVRGLALYEHLGGPAGTLLPLPEIQILGGGAHAAWRNDVQDYLLIATGARSYEETLEITHNVYHAAGELMRSRGAFSGLADEGGYWPCFKRNEDGLSLLVQAIERAGYEPGTDASISLDIAASDLFNPRSGRYEMKLDCAQLTSAEMIDLMEDWTRRYPILSIEDPVADVDRDAWIEVRRRLGGRVQLIGDDLFTTSPQRIRDGIDHGLANSVLIKLNQIGTVTETLDAVELTQRAGWLPVISARSGETEDAFIAHLAVATNAGQLKVGSFARGERTAKWNEVLRIGRRLGKRARFEGAGIYRRILREAP